MKVFGVKYKTKQEAISAALWWVDYADRQRDELKRCIICEVMDSDYEPEAYVLLYNSDFPDTRNISVWEELYLVPYCEADTTVHNINGETRMIHDIWVTRSPSQKRIEDSYSRYKQLAEIITLLKPKADPVPETPLS